MKLKQQMLMTICIISAFFYSCSRQTLFPTQATNQTIPLLTFPDSLFKEHSIDLSHFDITPIHCYEPTFKIRDSFTYLERKMVGFTDDALFIRYPDFIVNLENMEEGAFQFPLTGARVLSKFGPRNGRRHQGIDLKINCRDTVLATFDGIVRMAGWTQGYGNVIVIRHYNGLETVYAHNSKHFVRSGDRIKAGTPISLTGETGRATTDHLHFEIRVNGIPINPELIIDFENQTLFSKCLVFSLDKKGQIKIEMV